MQLMHASVVVLRRVIAQQLFSTKPVADAQIVCSASKCVGCVSLGVCQLQAAKDYEDMAAELHKHTQLSNMFDCPEAVVSATEGVAAIKADLVVVKDVWDASSLVEQQFQV